VHEPAPRLDSLDPHRLPPLELLDRMVPHMAFTEPWNATGQPALSLPLGFTPDGLPTGVQLVAAPGREDVLIAVAARLLDGDRDGISWSGREPALHA
jgi:amidase